MTWTLIGGKLSSVIFPECVPGFSLVRYLPVAGKECWSRLKLLSAPCFVESGHCHRLSRGSRSSSCRGNSWLWHSNPNSHILSNCLPDPEDPYTVRCMRNLNDRSIKGLLLYILSFLAYRKVAIWLPVPRRRRTSKGLFCPRPTFAQPSTRRSSSPTRPLASRRWKWNCWQCVYKKKYTICEKCMVRIVRM